MASLNRTLKFRIHHQLQFGKNFQVLRRREWRGSPMSGYNARGSCTAVCPGRPPPSSRSPWCQARGETFPWSVTTPAQTTTCHSLMRDLGQLDWRPTHRRLNRGIKSPGMEPKRLRSARGQARTSWGHPPGPQGGRPRTVREQDQMPNRCDSIIVHLRRRLLWNSLQSWLTVWLAAVVSTKILLCIIWN